MFALDSESSENQFHFSSSREVLLRLPMERIEMIYMMAFRGLLKELREGDRIGRCAMMFRSGVAALLDIRCSARLACRDSAVSRCHRTVRGDSVAKVL